MSDKQDTTPSSSNINNSEENKLIAERRAKLATIREAGVAFPNDFRRDSMDSEVQAELGEQDKTTLEALNRSASVVDHR